MTLGINHETCIKCGKCVRVCPADIFSQQNTGAPINLNSVDNCIVCGHCVDVCPTNSIMHSEFPLEKQHMIDYTLMPTPEQMMELIKARRSNRSITSKPISKKQLEQIIEAAHFAPTATNSQSLSYTIVTNPQKLKFVADYTIGIFDSLAKILLNPIVKLFAKPLLKDTYKYAPMCKQLKEEHEAGKDPILRKATALIFIHTPKSNRFGSEDANLAYQNASLMAQSLGISQIYMGFVLTAIKQDSHNKLAKTLGIDGKIEAIMALGIPAFRYPQYTDRKEISKKYLE